MMLRRPIHLPPFTNLFWSYRVKTSHYYSNLLVYLCKTSLLHSRFQCRHATFLHCWRGTLNFIVTLKIQMVWSYTSLLHSRFQCRHATLLHYWGGTLNFIVTLKIQMVQSYTSLLQSRFQCRHATFLHQLRDDTKNGCVADQCKTKPFVFLT